MAALLSVADYRTNRLVFGRSAFYRPPVSELSSPADDKRRSCGTLWILSLFLETVVGLETGSLVELTVAELSLGLNSGRNRRLSDPGQGSNVCALESRAYVPTSSIRSWSILKQNNFIFGNCLPCSYSGCCVSMYQ